MSSSTQQFEIDLNKPRIENIRGVYSNQHSSEDSVYKIAKDWRRGTGESIYFNNTMALENIEKISAECEDVANQESENELDSPEKANKIQNRANELFCAKISASLEKNFKYTDLRIIEHIKQYAHQSGFLNPSQTFCKGMIVDKTGLPLPTESEGNSVAFQKSRFDFVENEDGSVIFREYVAFYAIQFPNKDISKDGDATIIKSDETDRPLFISVTTSKFNVKADNSVEQQIIDDKIIVCDKNLAVKNGQVVIPINQRLAKKIELVNSDEIPIILFNKKDALEIIDKTKSTITEINQEKNSFYQLVTKNKKNIDDFKSALLELESFIKLIPDESGDSLKKLLKHNAQNIVRRLHEQKQTIGELASLTQYVNHIKNIIQLICLGVFNSGMILKGFAQLKELEEKSTKKNHLITKFILDAEFVNLYSALSRNLENEVGKEKSKLHILAKQILLLSMKIYPKVHSSIQQTQLIKLLSCMNDIFSTMHSDHQIFMEKISEAEKYLFTLKSNTLATNESLLQENSLIKFISKFFNEVKRINSFNQFQRAYAELKIIVEETKDDQEYKKLLKANAKNILVDASDVWNKNQISYEDLPLLTNFLKNTYNTMRSFGVKTEFTHEDEDFSQSESQNTPAPSPAVHKKLYSKDESQFGQEENVSKDTKTPPADEFPHISVNACSDSLTELRNCKSFQNNKNNITGKLILAGCAFLAAAMVVTYSVIAVATFGSSLISLPIVLALTGPLLLKATTIGVGLAAGTLLASAVGFSIFSQSNLIGNGENFVDKAAAIIPRVGQ